MSNRINRVEEDLNQWRSREERFNKLFSFGLSKNSALLKEKLSYYDRITTKYRGTLDLDERFALNLLKQERRDIEKQLYPNYLMRLLRRIFISPVKKQIVKRRFKRDVVENTQALHDQVRRAGFSELSTRISAEIKQGSEQFSIPASYYLNEKERIDHQLSFVKDPSGKYHFEGYKSVLFNEAKPGEKKQQYFSTRQGYQINRNEAHNLLSGRSVHSGGSWIQLDFNDKDSYGNYRFKQFHSEYGYELGEALQQLPLKNPLNKVDFDKLHQELKMGNRVPVTLIKDNKEHGFYIDANPQFKSVNIYDDHEKKISLHKAIGDKTVDNHKVVQKISEHHQKTQKKGARIY